MIGRVVLEVPPTVIPRCRPSGKGAAAPQRGEMIFAFKGLRLGAERRAVL